MIKKPYIAIIWFIAWGIFQAYAVGALLTGNWHRPESFPEQAYNTLVYPDMLFIPIYFLASIFLFFKHQIGIMLGLIAGGAVMYVMVYLLALSGFKGTENLIFDSIFLIINIFALWNIVRCCNLVVLNK